MSCQYEKTINSQENACPVLGFKDVIVGVPVEIKPFAQVGKIETECVGKPIVSKGITNCEEKSEQFCKFTVSQKVRVEIPIIFGAKTKIGDASIDCKHCGLEKDLDQNHIPEVYNINE